MVFVNSPLEVILQTIIDDGHKSRSHRKNFFQTEFKMMGVATHKHTEYEMCNVITYAGGLYNQDKEDPIQI